MRNFHGSAGVRFACAAAVALIFATTNLTAVRAQTCGDADGDGNVTDVDGVRVLRAVALLGECPLERCDTDANGSVTDIDAVNVLRAAVLLPGNLQCRTQVVATRREMLESISDVVILPSYRALAAHADALHTAAAGFAANPDAAALAVLRTEWRATRDAWKETEAFRLGPSEELRIANRIDWSIVRGSAMNTDRLESEIAGGMSLTGERIDDLPSNTVGSLAIEYLIFDPNGDAAVLDAFAGGGSRRGEMLVALAANVRDKTAELRAAWEPDAGNFRRELIEAGNGSDAFPTLKAAIDELVNRMLVTLEAVEEGKLGAPLGVHAGGTPHPELIEAPRSGRSREDVIADLAGFAHVYEGRRGDAVGAGVGAVVRGISPEIDTEIEGLLDEARAAVAAIPPPLERALVENRDAVMLAYERVQALRRAVRTDLVSVLGVTLSLGGNDGD